MKKVFHHSTRRQKKYPLLEIAPEIGLKSQYSLPRHLPRLATKSHRGIGSTSSNKVTPKVCQIGASQRQTNLAWNILNYQLGDRAIVQKHWENVRFNLEHRLEKANSQGDWELVGILQAEYKQLTT